MRLLSSTDVGVKALLVITVNPDRRVQLSEIADLFNLKIHTLKRPLGALVEGGIIASRIGRSGGYSLSRPARRITLAEVVKLLENDFHLIPAMDPNHPEHLGDVAATYTFVLEQAKAAFLSELAKCTIAELAGDPATLQLLGIPIPPHPHRRSTDRPQSADEA